jgi:Prenyltransferase and squalene oxidase repeat
MTCPPAFGVNAQDKGYLESTVRFLQEAQNPDGGFGATPGGPSDPDISAWAAIGLAAAGINPQQQARPGGRSVYTYLTEHAGELHETTNFERALLVADAAGTSPHDFGGVDLVQQILKRKLPEGGGFVHEAGEQAAHEVNDTVFAILSLSPVHEPAVEEAIQQAAQWLVEAQGSGERNGAKTGGSWNATCLDGLPACMTSEGEGPRGEVDMTGAAIQALEAARPDSSEAQQQGLTEARQRAVGFLGEAQSSAGGFPELFPQEPDEAQANAASTSWAVQALWSAGENPEAEAWHRGGAGPDPLEFLIGLQHPNGSIGYVPGESEGSAWMTAYTAAALAGQPLPIVDVPLKESPPPTSAPSSAPPSVQLAPARASQPLAKPSHRTGVLAGGGGRGARLFSRPRPGGQGTGQGSLREPQAVSSTTETAPTPQPSAASVPHVPTPRSSRPASARHTAAHRSGSRAGTSSGSQSISSGSQVRGLLLDEPLASHIAPGLRSATVAAGGSWTTTAILVGLALLVVAGARLERRRPGVRR